MYYIFTSKLLVAASSPRGSVSGLSNGDGVQNAAAIVGCDAASDMWQLVGTLGYWPLAESAVVPWLAQWWRFPEPHDSYLGLSRLPTVGPPASTSNYPKSNNLFQCQ